MERGTSDGQLPRTFLFGPLVIQGSLSRIGPRDFGGRKPKQILEILLLARGRHVSKDILADLLWNDDELPENPDSTIETYVAVLRRHLRAALPDGALLIQTLAGAYRFDYEGVSVDVERFDGLLAEAGRRPPADALPLLEAALALVTGDLLEDEPYAEWTLGHRAEYREKVLQALLDASAAHASAGNRRLAIAHANKALSLDNTNERAYRLAASSLGAEGFREKAFRMLSLCERVLDRELGVEPEPETIALREALARSPGLRGGAIELVDLDVREFFPSLASQASPAFVGRRAEINAAREALRRALSGAGGMLLIEGHTGMGKSRFIDEVLDTNLAASVIRTTCFISEQTVSYAAIVASLRRAARGLRMDATDAASLATFVAGVEDGHTKSRDLLILAALNTVAAVVRDYAPVIFVFDDLHNADRKSIEAIDVLRRAWEGERVAVAGAYRPDGLAPEHPIWQLSPSLTVRLGPLSEEDLAGAGLRELFLTTGGQPTLVTNCLQAHQGSGRLAETSLEVIRAQFGGWGTLSYSLIETATTLGQPIDPEELAFVAELDRGLVIAELERLGERHVLKQVGERFEFAAALTRELLLRALSPARRRLTEQRLARFAGVAPVS